MAPLGRRAFVVGLGGAATSPSSPERALGIVLAAAERGGAEVQLFGGAFLKRLPHYEPKRILGPEEGELLAAVRRADAVVIASPGYHGSVSGMLKNALDLLEETAADARPYLSGRAVGLIATAYGWQATGATIATLRAIVHALRGWPTPYAAAVNSAVTPFDLTGRPKDPAVVAQLELVAEQVLEFVTGRAAVSA